MKRLLPTQSLIILRQDRDAIAEQYAHIRLHLYSGYPVPGPDQVAEAKEYAAVFLGLTTSTFTQNNHPRRTLSMTPTLTKQQQMRRWQIEAAIAYAEANAWHFLARVTPGGGKTYWALRIAQSELCQENVERIVLVVPTLPIKDQWIEQFAEHLGLKLVDYNAYEPGGIGFITTYHQVASEAGAENFRKYCEEFKVFVIFDEVHHASDKNTWGERLRYAFNGAARILSLTGTPFRSDGCPVPFVRYEDNVCQPEYSFVYPQALADNIVRSLRFVFYDGKARWQRDGDPPEEGQVSITGEESPETLAAALDPSGDFARAMIEGAHHELMQMPAGAAGLLVAKDTEHANHLAGLLAEITGCSPVVVHTANPGSKRKIKAFRHSLQQWIVSVRMVSEGVDIPRVRVICWMTNYKTQLYFEQLIARGLRGPASEDCVVVMPELPSLVAMSFAVTHASIPALSELPGSSRGEYSSSREHSHLDVEFLGSEGYLSKTFRAPSTLVESAVMTEHYAQQSDKARAYQKQYRESPKYQDRIKSAEYLEKEKARKSSPEFKEANLKRLRNRYASDPEVREKISVQKQIYREKNRESVSEKKAQWQREKMKDPAYRERMRAHQREHARKKRAANPEKTKEQQRQSYHRHREKRLESLRLARQADPERFREIDRKKHERKKSREIGLDITVAETSEKPAVD